ncbi:biotin/lipoyl-containing protein [Halomonas salifodinae]|uniref:biotin/lipoyl-containing protein n=1 Tax=Halomonas salifodinae TaxID=438745 RepID=UPI00339F553F
MYLRILDKGFELASNVLEFIRENDERNREINERHHSDNIVVQEKLRALVIESNEVLLRQVSEIPDRIVSKIESDKLEELVNRTETLRFAIDLENMDLVNSMLADLLPLSKYALSRLNENKEQWFLPWMQATSISLLALRLSANTSGARKLLNEEVKLFRFEILNKVKSRFLVEEDVPWLELSDFVRGENENILLFLGEESALPVNFQEDESLEETVVKELRLGHEEGDLKVGEKYKLRDAEKISVLKVFLEEGDKVKEGDSLFLLDCEFDKVVFEYCFSSSFSGRVNRIYVKEGEGFNLGDILLDYEV